jgi:hypothetical protein
MPGRLLIDDDNAELASTKRVASFVKDRPVSHVLGGHIEFDTPERPFRGSPSIIPRARPGDDERRCARPADSRQQLQRLRHQKRQFVLINSVHNLIALAIAVGLVLVALVLGLILYIRRRRRTRKWASGPLTGSS